MSLSPALSNRFGDRYSTSQPLREQHGRGESHHMPAIPDAVVFAQTTEDVAEIVRLCAAESIPVARMELMDRGLINAVNAYSNFSRKTEDTLAFEFHGSPVGVQEQVEMVAIVEENGSRDFEWANAAEEQPSLEGPPQRLLCGRLSA